MELVDCPPRPVLLPRGAVVRVRGAAHARRLVEAMGPRIASESQEKVAAALVTGELVLVRPGRRSTFDTPDYSDVPFLSDLRGGGVQ